MLWLQIVYLLITSGFPHILDGKIWCISTFYWYGFQIQQANHTFYSSDLLLCYFQLCSELTLPQTLPTSELSFRTMLIHIYTNVTAQLYCYYYNMTNSHWWYSTSLLDIKVGEKSLIKSSDIYETPIPTDDVFGFLYFSDPNMFQRNIA